MTHRMRLFQQKPDTPVPVSISVLKSHGVSKRGLHAVCVNLFTIPDALHDLFSEYYLRYWNGEYCANQVEEGTITYGLHNYLVIYQNCTPFQVRRAAQVKLSFRAAIPEYEIPAYVIVRLV